MTDLTFNRLASRIKDDDETDKSFTLDRNQARALFVLGVNPSFASDSEMRSSK